MDELVSLCEIAEDKSKMALMDLMRLLVLEGMQAEYLVQTHWELISVCAIEYNLAQDVDDKEAKLMQNYHITCLKLLANAFFSDKGKAVMQDTSRL